MAIAMAKQQGSSVAVYNERNSLMFTKAGTLHGYTSGNVTVRQGNSLLTYDEKGRLVSSRPA